MTCFKTRKPSRFRVWEKFGHTTGAQGLKYATSNQSFDLEKSYA